MLAVEAGVSPVWHPVGPPRPLFEFDARELAFHCLPTRCHDVAPDRQRFCVARIPTPAPPPVVTHINLITNWFGELKAKAPKAR